MRGGKRPGAGRPKGSENKATRKRREIAEAALEQGITPLEVMLQTMREKWEAGDKEGACQVAKDAAPYVHPKLSSVNANVDGTFAYRDIEIPTEERHPLAGAAWPATDGDTAPRD